jgi:hypothetical protein
MKYKADVDYLRTAETTKVRQGKLYYGHHMNQMPSE